MRKKHKHITYPQETIYFKWAGPEGFGEFGFICQQNNIECDNECMSKEFIKKRLCEMVDRSKLRS